MKKRFLISMLVFIFALLAGCSSSDDSGVKGKDKDGKEGLPKEVKIGYQVIPNAELLAKHQSALEKKFPDVKITWVEFDSGRDVNTAMASGNIDLGLVGSVPLATGIANDLPYQVYYIHDVIGDAESLVVQKDAGIQKLEDVVGKKIAVPFGSTAHFSLLMALDQAGIKPDQLSILDMQPQDILAAWLRKDIDGAFVWHPTLGKILEDQGVVLTSAKNLAEDGIVTSDVGVVQKKFAEAYPAFIKSYIQILDDSVKLYRDKPEDVTKELAGALGISEEQTKAQLEGLIWIDYAEQQDAKYLGTEGKPGNFAEVLQATGKFLEEQKIIPASPDLETYQSAIYHSK